MTLQFTGATIELSVGIVDIGAEVPTGHLSNTTESRYRMNQFPGYMKFIPGVIQLFLSAT
jgi:hypothetical protein